MLHVTNWGVYYVTIESGTQFDGQGLATARIKQRDDGGWGQVRL